MSVSKPMSAVDPHDTRRRVMAIVASSSGNLVEWYDFYAYSFFSLYFAHHFFPSDNRTAELLSAAGVFAAGFLMRPIGGWLFGRLADRKGPPLLHAAVGVDDVRRLAADRHPAHL